MSRLPLLGNDERTAEQDAVVARITGGKRASVHGRSDLQDEAGALRGPFNAMLYNPALGDAMQALGAAIRFETSLPGRLRELAILTVAVRWQSQYEWYAHEPIARAEGLTADVLVALQAGAKPAFEASDEALVFRFASELLDTRAVSDDLYAEAVSLLGAQAVVELVAVLGNYTLVSMVLNTFDVGLPGDAPAPFPRRSADV